MDTPATPPPSEPSAPPTGAAMTPPAPPPETARRGSGSGASTWPIVIGVLGIVFGAGGTLGGCLGGLFYLLMPMARGLLEEMAASAQGSMDAQVAQFDAMANHSVIGVIASGAGMLLAILLLVAGIGIIKRRRWGVSAGLVWAGLKIVGAIFFAWVGFIVNRDGFEAMEAAAADSASTVPGPPPGLFGMMANFAAVGVGLQLLWLWALPVFLIVWFARRRIRDDVGAWS